MKNGSYAGRRSIRTGPVGAGHAPPVREAAVVPPIRCAAPFPSLCCPDVSLRGAKRRGNLAVPGRITGKPSAKSQLPPRDCTPRALPRASRSGRHVREARVASALSPYNILSKKSKIAINPDFSGPISPFRLLSQKKSVMMEGRICNCIFHGRFCRCPAFFPVHNAAASG